MGLPAKLVRAQLNFFKPFVANCSLEITRKGQDKLGELMEAIHRRDVIVRDHDFGPFQGAWIMPKDERRQGVVLYLHGGGYTCGNLDYAKGFAATLSDECGVRVFCAAYRLAPEDRFPAALDDAVVSYQYLLSKGYPASQILLCGESAGGGLCAAVCIKARDTGEVNVAFQMPLYPMLDDRDTETSRDNHGRVWNTWKNHFGWRCYLRGTDRETLPPYAAPARVENMEGLPPAYTFVSTGEPFYAETLEYIRRLKDCGIPASADVYETDMHAFDMMHPKDALSIEAARRFNESFAYVQEHYFAPQK